MSGLLAPPQHHKRRRKLVWRIMVYAAYATLFVLVAGVSALVWGGTAQSATIHWPGAAMISILAHAAITVLIIHWTRLLNGKRRGSDSPLAIHGHLVYQRGDKRHANRRPDTHRPDSEQSEPPAVNPVSGLPVYGDRGEPTDHAFDEEQYSAIRALSRGVLVSNRLVTDVIDRASLNDSLQPSRKDVYSPERPRDQSRRS